MTLTVADIERWDAGSVHEVFHAASNRAQAAQDAANGLAQLPAFTSWGGQAAEAAREAIGMTRRDLDAHGNEAQAVAVAARSAADQIERLKSELATLKADAESLGMEIDTVSDTILPGPKVRGNPMEVLLKQEQLQPRLGKLVAEANAVDIALANAIHMADGSTPVPASPHDKRPESQAALNKPLPQGPKSPQDMLLPAGSDAAGADRAPGAQDSPGGQPANLSGALDKLAGTRVPASVGPPPLPAKEIEAFKTSARQILASQGVPPEQIESRLSDIVARAQRQGWGPIYRPTEPARMPAPGFGEGFGDAWRNSEQGIKHLLGQGGPGAPGVLDSWKALTKGINDAATNPVGTAIGEVKHALDSPSAAYYAGEKAFDATAVAATAPFGGEGAAVRAGLPAELVTDGGAPLAVMRGWDPLGGKNVAEFQNLYGTPEARIWPDNDGFPPGFIPQPAHLSEGTIIDRFGSEYGRYLSPDGTFYGDRAITPETVGGEYNRYMVTGKSLPPGWQVVEGPVQPWFGQTPSPGSIQYMVTGPDGVKVNVRELVDRGLIDEYGSPFGR